MLFRSHKQASLCAFGPDCEGRGVIPHQLGVFDATMRYDGRHILLCHSKWIMAYEVPLNPAVPPRKFKVHDLINIAVQQQKKYSADGTTNTKKEWDLSGKLQEWFHIYPHERLGSDPLQNGKPGFQFNTKNENKMKGENEREDKFITHIQATIVDVKPNGNLVLEASSEEEHDEEHFTITLTGVCRSEDVGPSNTILSTQIANLVLVEKNKGAVRDATTRGWIPKVLDYAKPF